MRKAKSMRNTRSMRNTKSMRKAKSMRKTKKNKMFGGAITTLDGTDYSEKLITIVRPISSGLPSMMFKDYFDEFNKSTDTTPVTFTFDENKSDKKTWFLIKELNKDTNAPETHIVSFTDKQLLTDDLQSTPITTSTQVPEPNTITTSTKAATRYTSNLVEPVFTLSDKKVIALNKHPLYNDHKWFEPAYRLFTFVKKNRMPYFKVSSPEFTLKVNFKNDRLTMTFPGAYNELTKLAERNTPSDKSNQPRIAVMAELKKLLESYKTRLPNEPNNVESTRFTITDDLPGQYTAGLAKIELMGKNEHIYVCYDRNVLSQNRSNLN